jgi:hypothetical protein
MNEDRGLSRAGWFKSSLSNARVATAWNMPSCLMALGLSVTPRTWTNRP